MLKLGKAIADLYPTLNRDLLYAGIILHDVGKVVELSGPVATMYTVEGNLLGHITIMVNEIAKIASELEIEGEEVMLLQHMVLSHHGKEEWGSPKKPMIQEAEILHYIDNIDAKMNMLTRALGKTTPGEFTERLFLLIIVHSTSLLFKKQYKSAHKLTLLSSYSLLISLSLSIHIFICSA